MERVHTLFERQFVSYQSLGLTSNDRLFEDLEFLSKKTENLIQFERDGIRATQFVGVIKTGDHTIQILPKIDYGQGANSEEPMGSAEYKKAADLAAENLLHLLAHTNNLKLHNQSLASLSTGQGTWLELLTRLFAVELLTQLQQGFHQDYVRREDFLPYIRGRWNIARQFSRQPNLVQGLDVSYDDYLPDNLLNQTFRLAVNLLQRVTHDTQNLQMLADLESWLMPVHLPIRLSPTDLDRVEFNRLNERFYPAFQLARMLLENFSVRLLAGGQRAFAFVFNMDQLFEQFVANILLTYRRKILPEDKRNLRITLRGRDLKRYLVRTRSQNGESMFHLEPDILLGLPDQANLIIDTKNKRLDAPRAHLKVDKGDVYQMLAYATRFSCEKVLLLYPQWRDAKIFPPKELMVENSNVRIFVATLNLHQPLNKIFPLVQEFSNVLNFIFSEVDSPSEVTWPA